MKRFCRQRPRGFALQEAMVAIVVLGLALVPIVRGLSYLPRVAAAVAAQGRREAWRSLTDQAVAVGIDPGSAPLLRLSFTPVENAGGPADALPTGAVEKATLPARAGCVTVVALHQSFAATAEARGISLGFQLGPGLPPPRRTDPLPPLPPTVFPPPTVSPAGSPVLALGQLMPSGPGQPYVAELSAEAQAGPGATRVTIRQEAPRVQQMSGAGSSAVVVDAVELANRVRGRAWSEYAGDPSVDRAVALADGRVRWLHPVGDGRFQTYEPSEFVQFEYGISLGRPEYRVSEERHLSGTAVTFDYATALEVETRRVEAVIGFGEEVRAAFGDQWTGIEPAFVWTFGGRDGDSSAGNTRDLFTGPGRAFWADEQYLTATPVSPLPGLQPLLQGTWIVRRITTPLRPPVRLTPTLASDTDAPGVVDFGAPPLGEGERSVGRPEINGVQSVGATLTVPLIP